MTGKFKTRRRLGTNAINKYNRYSDREQLGLFGAAMRRARVHGQPST